MEIQGTVFTRLCFSQNRSVRKDKLYEGHNSQEFSIGKDIIGTIMVFFFSCFYLGYVTSLPASICCSQKTWYFSKLAIKNNWQLFDWARIQYRVSDQSCTCCIGNCNSWEWLSNSRKYPYPCIHRRPLYFIPLCLLHAVHNFSKIPFPFLFPILL